ncbi:MAG: hypothetical protein C4518_09775 [Desulfobacteraceae bacterium]|nr:MAG: hypothetical protein C4518_09775 [Desulfobacteraceae bacterium]
MPKKMRTFYIILILNFIASTMVFAGASDDQSLLGLEESDKPQKPAGMQAMRQNTQPNVRETLLGKLPKGYQIIPDSIKMSPDLRDVAYAAYSDETHNIIQFNNQTSPIYYAVQPNYPIFSPEKNRYAYIAYKNKDKVAIVVDGQTIDTPDNAGNFLFSPNGARYACRAQKNNQQYTIVDGIPGPTYKGIPIKDNFAFSDEGERFIYVALKNDSCVAVVDGREETSAFNFITSVRFSMDSTQYAYKARTEKKANGAEKWCVVQNGKAGKIYDRIFDLIFSYDSKHLAYTVINNKKLMLVFDGREMEPYDIVGLPVFSFDSKSFAYAYSENKKWYIIINDEKSSAFDQIYKFYFSPDSKRSAFFARTSDEWDCIVDGKKSVSFDKMVETFKFSPDSTRYVYAGVNEDGSQMIVDGIPGSVYKSVGEPYFSPDSKTLVYRAIRPEENKWITVLDNRESKKRYNGIGKYEFSPDSRHLAFPAFISINQTVMVVDGNEECADKNYKILGDPTFSPNGNYIVYHAMAAPENWHLVINGQVLPGAYGGFMKGTPIIFDSPTHFHTLGVKAGGEEFVLIDVDIPETLKLTSELKS